MSNEHKQALSSHHGHEVWAIDLGPDDSIESSPGRQLYFEEEYMGDHSEHWIVGYNLKGEEVSRYNVRQIRGIVWRKP